MTGFNHATTGALIAAAVGNPFVAVPLAFASHFIMDAVPHFGWDLDEDVFVRNRSKELKVSAAIEIPLTIIVLTLLPLLMRPIRLWWITLLVMLSALTPDFITFYRAFLEEREKRMRPESIISKLHYGLTHHHSNLVIGTVTELTYFAGALGLIIWLVHK